MGQILLKWIKRAYQKVITSIAFLPAIIALVFLTISCLMIMLDFSPIGKEIKSNLHWLSLKDASTARSICAAIASGILSLAVFSFSMVMILLSQAASQMSNRILGKLISNRFQQVVLGFYIGTIVYALFLLSTIRDINSGIYVPAMSTYLLIALTIVDIFLFIYFLHYITDSVKYETIIHKISTDTLAALQRSCKVNELSAKPPTQVDGTIFTAHKSGLFQGFEKGGLIDVCKKSNVVISFLYPVGTFVLVNTPLFKVHSTEELPAIIKRKLDVLIDIGTAQQINSSYYYGFKQLMEIAVKALSPGINDPGTASISLYALTDLLACRLQHFAGNTFKDDQDVVRIITKEKSFKEMFEEYVLPIWDYGKNDRVIKQAMLHALKLLQTNVSDREIDSIMNRILSEVEEKQTASN